MFQLILPVLALSLATGTCSRLALAQPESSSNPVIASAPSSPARRSAFTGRMAEELGVEGGLTAEEVALRAVATSYSLQARDQEIAQASAEVDRAFLAYLPRLQLYGRYLRLSPIATTPFVFNDIEINFDQPLDQWTFQAHLVIPISDYFFRVAKGHAASKLALNAAHENRAASELATIADAKTTYYAWVQARLGLLVALQALEDVTAHLSDVENALRVGSASQADVLAIESRVADSERLVTANRNLATRLEAQLRIIRHDPPKTTYRIGETLSGEGTRGLPEQLSELTHAALASRPELKTLALRAEASQALAEGERSSAYPRVDLLASAQYDKPTARVVPPLNEFRTTWSFGAQASWTFSDIPSANAAARRQEAAAGALLAERQALMDQVRIQVATAYTAREDARAALRTSARSLAAAEEAHRVRRGLFQNGLATSTEVMEAESELTRARVVALGARIEFEIAQVRLDYALGRRPGAQQPRRR